MISYVIETLKIAGIDFFCEFEINGMKNDFFQRKFVTNKWLHLDEWFCIYEKLEELACDNWITSDVNETFIVSNYIQVDVKRQELKKYYKRLLIAEGLNANSVFLKISIKKLNVNVLMQDNAKLKERLRKLEEMQNVAIVNGKSSTKSNRIKMEYDPVESPTIRNEYVPRSIRNSKIIPYKPSKVIIRRKKDSESGKYSPKPIAVTESEKELTYTPSIITNLSQSTDISPISSDSSKKRYTIRGESALSPNCDNKSEISIPAETVHSLDSRTTLVKCKEKDSGNDIYLKSTNATYLFGSEDSEMSDMNLDPNTTNSEALLLKSKMRKNTKRKREKSVNSDNLYNYNVIEINNKLKRIDSAEVEIKEEEEERGKNVEILTKTFCENKLKNCNKNIKAEIIPNVEKHDTNKEDLLTTILKKVNNQLDTKYKPLSRNKIL